MLQIASIASGESELLLQSTFEVENQLYEVKLTTTEIQRKVIEPLSGFNSQAFRKAGNQLQLLFFESNSTDKVYYQPINQTDLDEPVLILPLSQKTSSILSCCPKSNQEMQPFCSLCENKIEKLLLKEVIAVHADDQHKSGVATSGDMSFTIWTVVRSKNYTWSPKRTVFKSSDAAIVSQWLNKIREIIFQSGFNRPKSLLIFLNPIAGKRKAVRIFHEKIAPLFQLANITTQLIQTQHRYHARNILQTCDLQGVDGIVSVGGDGLFAEIVDGLLTRTMKEAGRDHIYIDTILEQPRWMIGIIPAGSTDTVSYSTQGINDPVSSALHIILGDCTAIDVGTVFHNNQFVRYNISFLGYGYYGDCILDSEQNRWMGPKRYDWEGFKKVIANRSYNGEISFLESSNKESHPRDGTACKSGCLVCHVKTDILADERLSRQSVNSATTDDSLWQTVKGRFTAVNSFLMSCRCRYAPEGPAPAAHLANGCADLVLVHDCSRLQYLNHLYRCASPNADQFEFSFIQVFRITRFKFRPAADDEDDTRPENQTRDAERLHDRRNSTSVWNCDGEVIDEPTVEYIVHPRVIRLFARGIEDNNEAEASCCSSCMSHASRNAI